MEHFRPSEFVCKCGECKEIPPTLVGNVLTLIENLNCIRDVVSSPIRVTSGVRCEKHNRAVGGKENSMHLLGKAADITVDSMSTERLAGLIDALITVEFVEDGGLGVYKSFIHYDTGIPRRWTGN